MSISELLRLAGRVNRHMPNQKLVKDWWPKPQIRTLPERFWGDKWQNINSGCMHKYECSSFSSVGFHTNKKNKLGLPSNLCLAYGETPEQAYNQWCEVFESWNNKQEWVK